MGKLSSRSMNYYCIEIREPRWAVGSLSCSGPDPLPGLEQTHLCGKSQGLLTGSGFPDVARIQDDFSLLSPLCDMGKAESHHYVEF